jgi:hypothetical protein
MMNDRQGQTHSTDSTRMNILFLGLTAIFLGIFMVWLPGPSVGLQIIGIEMGEWIKFLGVGARRDLFYLPPIVLGLTLALLAATWPNNRPQTWLMRATGVAVATLAFPPIAAIQLEPAANWLPRLLAIVLVALVAGVGAVIAGRNRFSPWPWLAMSLILLAGAILPTWQYLAVRGVFEGIMLQPVGVGAGVWMDLVGGLLAASVTLVEFVQARRNKKQPSEGRLPLDNLVA